MKTTMQQQQQQKPKQLTLFQAGFKKDEVSKWGVPMGTGTGSSHHFALPTPVLTSAAAGATATAAAQQDNDIILIDDDEDDLLLAQALDQTMR